MFLIFPQTFSIGLRSGDFRGTVTSCMHLKHRLHDEFIGWLIIAHVTEQDADVKSKI